MTKSTRGAQISINQKILAECLVLDGLVKENCRHIKPADIREIGKSPEKAIQLDGEFYRQLNAWAHTHELTLNAMLQYAWHKALSAYSNELTTVVGVAVLIPHAHTHEMEESVEFYLNTVPLIFEHQAEERILDALQAIQSDIDEANSLKNIDLERLQQDGERLFNSVFVFENAPMRMRRKNDNFYFQNNQESEKLDYPLVVIASEYECSITLTLKYASCLSQVALNRYSF